MDRLQLAHAMLVATWGGLVLAELVMEAVSWRPSGLRQTANIHYWVDLFFELPLLAGVVGTGAFLLWRAWPPTLFVVVKVLFAAVALTANLWCVWLVVRRKRGAGLDEPLLMLSRKVRWTGVGVPFGAVALWMGLQLMFGP